MKRILRNRCFSFWLPVIFMLVLFSSAAFAVNIDFADKYAWSEKAGWINFRPGHGGVTVYSDHLVGFAWAENIGWIRFGSANGGGTPDYYPNTTSWNWGVNRASDGSLSGYAWSEKAGWINFNPTHSQVVINPVTGEFGGYAWAENIGWVHFANISPPYKVAIIDPSAPSVRGSAVPVVSTTPKWTWTGISGGTGRFRIKLDNNNLEQNPIYTYDTFYEPDHALTQGEHILYVQELETTGFWSAVGEGSFTVHSPANAIFVSEIDLNVYEPGGTDWFVVSLSVRPREDVVINLMSTDTNAFTIDPVRVVLTPDNWDTGVTVTVTDSDANLINTKTCRILTMPAFSGDGYFAGMDADDISVKIWDDAAFAVYSVVPKYAVAGDYVSIMILGDGFSGNTQVFYRRGNEPEKEATNTLFGSTYIMMDLPDRNQDLLPTAGQVYTLRVTDGDRSYEKSFFFVSQTDLDAMKRKKAIVVAGGGLGYPEDYLWEATQACADKTYDTLEFQGYTYNTITYLSAEQSNPLYDVENLYQTITGWGAASVETGYPIDELLIYMTGHGDTGRYLLKGAENLWLSAGTLRGWLDEFQTANPDIRVIIIYDACLSGSFVNLLRNPDAPNERIVVTSTTADQNAMFADNGDLSFSGFFWGAVELNGHLCSAFNSAFMSMGENQTPMMEIPPEYSETNDIKIGLGLIAGASHIKIDWIDVQPAILNGELGEFSSTITVKVSVDEGYDIDSAFVKIRNPPAAPGEPVMAVTGQILSSVQGSSDTFWRMFDCFTKKGTYDIFVSAITFRGSKKSDTATARVQQLWGSMTVKGDIDSSDQVNLADAIMGLRILSGIPVQGIRPNYEIVDIPSAPNAPVRIGLEDVTFVLQKVAGVRQ